LDPLRDKLKMLM